MKVLKYLLFFFLFPFLGNSQIDSGVNIRPFVWFSEGTYEENDTISKDKYYASGVKQVEYIQKDQQLVRREYYGNGWLKSQAEIIQQIGRDTVIRYRDSMYIEGNEQVVVISYLMDIVNGDYIEYYNIKNLEKIKEKGKCLEAERIGEWIFYGARGKTIVNYNEQNEVEGKYQEFCFSRREQIYILTIDGEYGMRTYPTNYFDRKLDKKRTSKKRESRRVGIWKYYSKDGLLLEEVSYDWKVQKDK